MPENNTLASLHVCVEKTDEKGEQQLKQVEQDANSPFHAQKLQAAFMTSKLWPKGTTIKISFNPQTGPDPEWTPLHIMNSTRDSDGNILPLDPLETEKIRGMSNEEAVKKVIRERIDPICNLNFEFVENGGNIRISFETGKGAWSLLGTDCLQATAGTATMNFGWLDVATIIHEFCHAIGMVHEHQNPRGETIPWDVPKVLKWAELTQGWDEQKTRTNILDKYDLNLINGSEYDPYSIMLYFFPGTLTTTGKGTSQNKQMSNYDIIYINKIYPGSEETPEEFSKRVYNRNVYATGNPALMREETSSKNIIIAVAVIVIIALIVLGVIYRERLLSMIKGEE